MAPTSACRVTSPSYVTLLIDSATVMPSRQTTAAYGYSPALPDAFERPMQWPIIRRSIASTFIPTPDRVALQLRTRAASVAFLYTAKAPTPSVPEAFAPDITTRHKLDRLIRVTVVGPWRCERDAKDSSCRQAPIDGGNGK